MVCLREGVAECRCISMVVAGSGCGGIVSGFGGGVRCATGGRDGVGELGGE